MYIEVVELEEPEEQVFVSRKYILILSIIININYSTFANDFVIFSDGGYPKFYVDILFY
jgi:hypothetical protein